MDVRGLGLSEEELRQLGFRVRSEGRDSRRGGAPTPVPPTRSRRLDPAWRWWLGTVVVLLVVSWGSSLQRWLPSPAPAATPDTAFASARAMARLVEVARAPRPVGSPEHDRVRGYLIDRLRDYGLDPRIRTTTVAVRHGSHVRAATVRNVSAVIGGSDPSAPTVALTARYDAGPLSNGAGASGVGVATLLEVARAIAAGPPLHGDVTVAFVDAGALGGRALADELRAAGGAAVVLSVDARGGSGPSIPVETGGAGGRLIGALSRAGLKAPWHSAAGALLLPAPEPASPGSEPTPEAPETSVELRFVNTGSSAFRDQSRDVVGRVSERTLQSTGSLLLAAAREVAGADGRVPDAHDRNEKVYLTLPLAGSIGYGAALVVPTSIALVLLWVLMAAALRARGGGVRGAAIGAALGAVIVGGSAGAGRAMLELLAPMHPEFGSLATAFYRDAWHVSALAGVTLAISTSALFVARRRVRSDELFSGAMLAPLVFALWVTFRAPVAAPAVQWPVAVALITGLLVLAVGPARVRAGWAWLLVMVLSAAILALAVPGIELAVGAWSFRQATWLGGLLGLLMLMLVPAQAWLAAPRPWWTPALALAFAGTLVGLALPSVQGSVDHPVPTSLIYLAEAPVATGSMVSRAPRNVQDPPGRRTMAGEWLTIPGPGERWARSWVAEPPSGSIDAGVLLVEPTVDASSFSDDVYERAGGAPDSELAPPRMRVVRSALEGGRRRLEVALRRGLDGEAVGITIADGVDAELTGVGDATWEGGPTPVRSLTHWGAPAGDELVIALVAAPQLAEVTLSVAEHHLRPREVIGDYFFQRADSLVPNALVGTDRVIQRTMVHIRVPEAASAEAVLRR
jgi:hypothetical protein